MDKNYLACIKRFITIQTPERIGLFITKNQIEAMGGKVEVESKANVGTTFKIYFNNEI
jgi:signal transduction histidine kinase